MVLGTLLAVTGLLAVLGIVFAAPVVAVVAADAGPAKQADAVPLTRIMFPFLPCVAAAAVLMGVLNARKRYLVPAYAPVAFNLVAVAGGLGLLAWGLPVEQALVGWAALVLVGGLAQALVPVRPRRVAKGSAGRSSWTCGSAIPTCGPSSGGWARWPSRSRARR